MNLAAGGQLAGLGGQAAQLAQIPRGEAESERAFQAQQGLTGANLALQRAQALQGLGGQQFGQQQTLEQLGLQRAGAAQQAQLAGLGAQQGVLGQLAGLQGQQFGQEQALRGETRQDAAARLAQDQANLAARQGILGQLAGLEGQQFGQNLQGLGFQQGERQYQQGLQETATDRAIQQKMLEDQLLNSQFGRQMQQLGLAGQYGMQTSPSALSLADLYGQQGAGTQAAMGDLFANLGYGAGGMGQAGTTQTGTRPSYTAEGLGAPEYLQSLATPETAAQRQQRARLIAGNPYILE